MRRANLILHPPRRRFRNGGKFTAQRGNFGKYRIITIIARIPDAHQMRADSHIPPREDLLGNSARDAQRRGEPSRKMAAAGYILMAAIAHLRRVIRVPRPRHITQQIIIR